MGFTPQAAAKPKPAAKPVPVKTTAGAKKAGKTAAAPIPKTSANTKGSGNEFVNFLQETGLTDVLRPISHIHVLTVTYKPSRVPSPATSASGNAIALIDPVSFYETGFKNEGGHRLVWSDDNKSRLLIMGFDTPRKHFAVVSDSGSSVTIVRADGYPDVKKLSKLILMFTNN